MKSELERTKEALDLAMRALDVCSHQMKSQSFNDLVQRDIEEINAILNPPPEMEEVEESAGWVNIYPSAKPTPLNKMVVTNTYETRELADQNAASHRIDCQEIKVKVQRPKPQPVERSVEVWLVMHDGVLAVQVIGNSTCDDLLGKRGNFVYQEPQS